MRRSPQRGRFARKILHGHYIYYLYDGDAMTDSFANWSFMAAEDDDASVLAVLARRESKTYPRPLKAEALKNFPFSFDDDRIERAWEAVRETGAYPDIEQTFASNGDRYFYSTDHLSTRHAASLAEWNSVTVYENVRHAQHRLPDRGALQPARREA